jgi:C-terminal processing protease CtpA/Prc
MITGKDEPLDAIRAVAACVEERYVDLDAGARLGAHLRARADAGDFAGLTGTTLTDALTAALREEVDDKHLAVRWSEDPREASSGSDWDDPEFLAAYWREQDSFNQGVVKAERLPGNVGLIELFSLDEPEGTGHVVDAAFALLARCDALILDVRVSNGGAPSGVAYLVSHFLDAPARKLLDIVNPEGQVTEESWTTPYVRSRFAHQPAYVLVSGRTPSGAEELAYDLQALGRATVVGETTVGAANPVDQYVVTPHLLVRVPLVRVRHAITGGNWEGVGVVPDIACPAGDALDVAHRHAVRRLAADPALADRPATLKAEWESVGLD